METIYIKTSIRSCLLVSKKVINWMISTFCYVKYCRTIYSKTFITAEKPKKYHFKTLVLETLDVSMNHPRRTSIPSRLTKRVMSRKTVSSEEIYSRLNQFFYPYVLQLQYLQFILRMVTTFKTFVHILS